MADRRLNAYRLMMMDDSELRSQKFILLLGGFFGLGLMIIGLAIKSQGKVNAPQRFGQSTSLSGESAQEYAWIPLVLGVVVLIGCVAYWWTEIRPLRADD